MRCLSAMVAQGFDLVQSVLFCILLSSKKIRVHYIVRVCAPVPLPLPLPPPISGDRSKQSNSSLLLNPKRIIISMNGQAQVIKFIDCIRWEKELEGDWRELGEPTTPPPTHRTHPPPTHPSLHSFCSFVSILFLATVACASQSS